jgi:hypothetical protein
MGNLYEDYEDIIPFSREPLGGLGPLRGRFQKRFFGGLIDIISGAPVKPHDPPKKESSIFDSLSRKMTEEESAMYDTMMNQLRKKKDGGPIEDMMVVSGGPPDRGVKKMYGDSLFGYFKKGGHVKKFIQ